MSKAELYKALVRAQREVRALFKDSKNEHHKYAYTSAEAIVDEARKALGVAGLACSQISARFEPVEKRLQLGKQELVGRAIVSYRLVHESGEAEEYPDAASLPVIVSGGRPDDKAETAVWTSCLGYFLRGLLLIPRDDNAAAIDQRDDRDFQPDRSTVHEPERLPEARDAKPDKPAQNDAPRPDERGEWGPLVDEWTKRIKGARKASDIFDVVAEAKATKGLPAFILGDITLFAKEVDDAKRRAA